MALDTRWKNPQGSDPKQLHLWAQELIRELRKGEFFSTQVGDGITNAQLAEMAAWTIKARNNAAAGAPEDVDRPDLTAAAAPAITHELLGFLSSNELRRMPTGIVGGLQLLNSGTVAAATLPIVLTGFTGYRGLRLVLSAFVPATTDTELWLRTSTDGGANYDAGASDYSWLNTRSRSGAAAPVTDPDAADSEIVVAGIPVANFSVSSTAGEGGAHVALEIFGQTATGRWGAVQYNSAYVADNGEFITIAGAGWRLATADIDALQILFESGNIASGSWALYGYA